MSAIVDSINLPQQKFFVEQEKLSDIDNRKVFLQQENFSTPQKFFSASTQTFCRKVSVQQKFFSNKKNFLLELQKIFSATARKLFQKSFLTSIRSRTRSRTWSN
jgi:hypothetical protein